MRKPVPLTELNRIPEQGRIRTGVKTERAMRALDTFRFTSSDLAAITQLSDVYGGTVSKWMPPRSKQQQWEVITDASTVRVFLPPNSITVWYEEWAGGGLVRRCDGVTMTVPTKTPDGVEMDEVPCACGPAGCTPHTRLQVILPEIRFGGVWRLESKGWNAANELPGMAQMLEQLHTMRIVEGKLSLEKRSKVSAGQTRHFIVPKLSMDTSPMDILAGVATISSLSSVVVPELEPVVDGVTGWDTPPPNVNVKRNPAPPPTYIPA